MDDQGRLTLEYFNEYPIGKPDEAVRRRNVPLAAPSLQLRQLLFFRGNANFAFHNAQRLESPDRAPANNPA